VLLVGKDFYFWLRRFREVEMNNHKRQFLSFEVLGNPLMRNRL